jgi:hypothetical protein
MRIVYCLSVAYRPIFNRGVSQVDYVAFIRRQNKVKCYSVTFYLLDRMLLPAKIYLNTRVMK